MRIVDIVKLTERFFFLFIGYSYSVKASSVHICRPWFLIRIPCILLHSNWPRTNTISLLVPIREFPVRRDHWDHCRKSLLCDGRSDDKRINDENVPDVVKVTGCVPDIPVGHHFLQLGERILMKKMKRSIINKRSPTISPAKMFGRRNLN